MIRYLLQDQVGDSAQFPQVVRAAARSLTTVKFMSVTLMRASQLAGRILPALGSAVKQVNHILTGADIAWQARIGPGLKLHHPTGVVIGPGVRIGAAAIIQQGVTIGGRGGSGPDGSPTLGDGVLVAAGARVVGPILLGDGAMIGANAVVLESFPSGAVVVGVPGRVLPSTRSQHDPA